MFIAKTPSKPLTGLLLTLSIVFGSACTQSPSASATSNTPTPVSQTAKQAQPSTTMSDSSLKVVLSWEELTEQTITAPTNGEVTQILIQDGQMVQAGQRLLQLQAPTPSASTKTITQAPNAQAKAQAYQKWQQDQALYAQGFISQAAVVKSEAAYRAASQNQVIIQTAASPIQAPAPMWLQAPFNGVIKPLATSHGNHVKNGQKLFVIVPTDVKRIKILVAQENHQPLFVGQRLHVKLSQQTDLWLQISELPPIEDKQYVLAYAVWPQDLPKPDTLDTYPAHLLLHAAQP